MADIVERLKLKLSRASPGDRMYERPMTWGEAEELLDEITRLRSLVDEAKANHPKCVCSEEVSSLLKRMEGGDE